MFSFPTRRSLDRFKNRREEGRRPRRASAAKLSIEPLEERTMLAAQVTNLGLDAASAFVLSDGDLSAFTVRERSQGNTDLNGDGDLFDNVLHIYDAASDTTTNLGLASDHFRLDGNLLAFTVNEGQQGFIDLTGDGDTNDNVVHIYDAATGTTTNLQLSVGSDLELNGSVLAFTVTEFGQDNTDLNGDGDTDDSVVHVYDATSGTTTNLELTPGPYYPNLLVNGDTVGFLVREDNQGNTDLNGDGDTIDLGVMHVYNAATGVTTNLGLDGLGGPFNASENLVAFSVLEHNQGNTDLNGDGDASDWVVHVYDPASGVTTNLDEVGSGFALEGNLVRFQGTGGVRVYDATSGVLTNLGLSYNGEWSPIVGGRFAFNVHEGAAGNVDLNGDGDTTDGTLIYVYDATTGVLTGLGLNGGFPQVAGDLISFFVHEVDHGDLNGDGDAFDNGVMHVHDLASGVTTNLGLGARYVSQLEGQLIAFTVPESQQGNTDLNGDGDTSDTVLHVYDAAAGATTNLKLAADGLPRLSGKRVAFAVREANQGNTDLNGDGDTLDLVMHVADFSVQTVDIDIQPHSDNNLINVAGNGMIAVALFTTDDFDASRIDIASVQFAGAFAAFATLHDVDGDGDLDMVLQFRLRDTILDEIYAQLVEDDLDDGILDSNHQEAQLSLTGQTLDEQLFQGSGDADLFLSGRALRDLLDELAIAQLGG